MPGRNPLSVDGLALEGLLGPAPPGPCLAPCRTLFRLVPPRSPARPVPPPHRACTPGSGPAVRSSRPRTVQWTFEGTTAQA